MFTIQPARTLSSVIGCRGHRKLLFAAMVALPVLLGGRVHAQQQPVDGVWAIGNDKACSTSPYQLQTSPTTWKFTDRKGTVSIGGSGGVPAASLWGSRGSRGG